MKLIPEAYPVSSRCRLPATRIIVGICVFTQKIKNGKTKTQRGKMDILTIDSTGKHIIFMAKNNILNT